MGVGMGVGIGAACGMSGPYIPVGMRVVASVPSMAAKGGIACILISSEMEELIGLCHRVAVMQDGKIISQTKTRAAKPQDQPEVTNMTTVDKGTVAHTAGANTVSLASSQQSSLLQNLDKFNDTSTSITSGSLFTSAV